MIELNDADILPDDLKALFDSLDYEEEGGLGVDLIEYLSNEVHLTFSLSLGDISQQWQLQILNYKGSKIDIDNLGGYFKFYSSHYLMYEYLDNSTELYVKKGCDNPEQLLSEIYKLHNTVFENYIPLERFLNGDDLLKCCKSQFGLFARGPKGILSYYFECLKKMGNEPYYIGDYTLTEWDGTKQIPTNKDLKLTNV